MIEEHGLACEKNDHIKNALFEMVNILIEAQRPPVYPLSKPTKEQHDGAFGFIPHSLTDNLNIFASLKERLAQIDEDRSNRIVKFLDAGCGCGNVLLQACGSGLADLYHGIEYYHETYMKAMTWLDCDKEGKNFNKFRILYEDIKEFNKYGSYDIVYYFCPLQDPSMEIAFEEKVEDEMKVGALLIPIYKLSRAIKKDERFKLFLKSNKQPVYIKIANGERKVTATRDRSISRNVLKNIKEMWNN